MKVRLDPSNPAQPVAGAAPLVKPPEVPAASTDDIIVSSASAALNPTGRIDQLTALVQGDSYETSSAATSYALVEDALSERN